MRDHQSFKKLVKDINDARSIANIFSDNTNSRCIVINFYSNNYSEIENLLNNAIETSDFGFLDDFNYILQIKPLLYNFTKENRLLLKNKINSLSETKDISSELKEKLQKIFRCVYNLDMPSMKDLCAYSILKNNLGRNMLNTDCEEYLEAFKKNNGILFPDIQPFSCS